jgi:hypothetical protein
MDTACSRTGDRRQAEKETARSGARRDEAEALQFANGADLLRLARKGCADVLKIRRFFSPCTTFTCCGQLVTMVLHWLFGEPSEAIPAACQRRCIRNLIPRSVETDLLRGLSGTSRCSRKGTLPQKRCWQKISKSTACALPEKKSD